VRLIGEDLQKAYTDESATWLRKLQGAVIKNVFEQLMEASSIARWRNSLLRCSRGVGSIGGTCEA